MTDPSVTEGECRESGAAPAQYPWVFNESGPFAAMEVAERFLSKRGFSVGRLQRGSPRGILFGDYDIQKWRNLRPHERAALHGLMTGDMRHGPVVIRIFDDAPPDARNALYTPHPPRPGGLGAEQIMHVAVMP